MSQIQVELQEWMGSDRAIANAAWTSTYNKDKREVRTDADVDKLVARLIQDGHSTPVESVVLRFWIRMPIFTDRQHMTHRIASHNGLSGRYRTMPEDFYQLPDDAVKILEKAGLAGIVPNYELHCRESNTLYREMVEDLKKAESFASISNEEFKRVRELVRGILPTSGMVERVTVMNLRSFANYQKLRNSSHAQPEIREVAREMLYRVKEAGVAPVAVGTLEALGWKI